jgi:hypothetical protein
VSDGDVGGDHVRGIGFRSLQKGREKLKFFLPFPSGTQWAESEKQCHCAGNKTWFVRNGLVVISSHEHNFLFLFLTVTFYFCCCTMSTTFCVLYYKKYMYVFRVYYFINIFF